MYRGKKKSTIILCFNPRPFPQTYRCVCRVLKWVSCQVCASMGTWKAVELLLLAESRLHLTLKSSKLTAWLITASFPKSSCCGDLASKDDSLIQVAGIQEEAALFFLLVEVLCWRGCPRVCPASTSCMCFNQWGSVVTCSILNWSRSCVAAFYSQAES